jgi:nicotinic acid mononucleotide adenylyltransferase
MPNNGSGSYGKVTKTPAGDRIDMCRLTIDDFFRANYKHLEGLDPYIPVEVSSIEIEKGFDYTYQLAEYLEHVYPRNDFYFIMGGDWDISKFKNWECIARVFDFIQIHRIRKDCKQPYIDECQNIQFNLSSTIIRERVAKGKTIRGLVTPSVERFIQEQGLYK